MIVLALLLAEAAPVLTPIGRQALPASGCAAFLWESGPPPQLVAKVEPGTLRVAVDGRPATLARVAARGEARLGLAESGDYVGQGLTATLDLTVTPIPNLVDGARVPAATLSVSRNGGDAAVIPLAGLVGCATATPERDRSDRKHR